MVKREGVMLGVQLHKGINKTCLAIVEPTGTQIA